MWLMISCKYEDGPLLSLVSIPNRITGDYHIESVTENGIDQMARIDTLKIDHLHFNDKDEYVGGNGEFWVVFVDTSKMFSRWALIYPGKEQIDFIPFGCLAGPGVPVPFQPLPGFLSDGNCDGEIRWDIIKLTNSKIWIKISLNNNEYEVHLKKIN